MKIGDIERKNVREMVKKEGILKGRMIGMNLMKKIGGFKVSGDKMIMIN